MKNNRHEKILDLISRYEIETQEELIEKLNLSGFRVTQATVSRDIRELKLSKVMTGRGTYRYILPVRYDNPIGIKFNNAIAESIISINYAQNIIVLKTYPGHSQAVAVSIDALNIPQILGCVAGDDTIIAVASDEESAKDISIKIKDIIKSI